MSGDEEELVIEQFEIGPMQNFTYLVGSRRTREVAVVDPAWDIPAIARLLEERDYRLKAALITHYHPDHCGGSLGGHRIQGVAELLESHPVKVYAHELEADGLRKVTGISASDLVRVSSGARLQLGDVDLEFLHTPGHTPGSQCFRIGQLLVSGDTLFVQGCGRVDLPGSSPEDMYRSLRKLAALPDETLLLPGHNYAEVPKASMAELKRSNVYLRIQDPDTWRRFMG